MSGGLRVTIMAGGTGGHVFPALAVARALAERQVSVRWLGTRHGMEAELVPAAGFPIDYISIAGLRGKGVVGWLLAPLRLSRAVWQARGALRAFRPHVVLGLGGFASGPGGLASRLLGLPLLIQEQNAIPGMTNRYLARLADRVMEGFPGTFSGPRVLTTGNPVRAEIAAVEAPEARLAGRSGRLRLLVVGGSLGAQALNEMVPAALSRLPAEARPEVLHQTGRRLLEAARGAYSAAGVEADVRPFIDDMAGAYGWADVVLCRAGALTVAELAAAGVGSLLVPYPHAVDDHQSANARYLTGAGAARLLPQSTLDADGLARVLEELAADAAAGRAGLLAMAHAARALARPDATAAVAGACLELAGEGNDGR